MGCSCDCHTMSKDRITFFISQQRYETEGSLYRQMIHDVFDLSPAAFNGAIAYFPDLVKRGVAITCRPSQYGRFMVMRNSLGFTNDVKGLQAVLFQPEPEKAAAIDVTKRSNRVWAIDSDLNFKDRL